MNRNSKIAAAVTTLLAAGAMRSVIAYPTLAQAQATTNVLYVSGASAARSAVLGAVEADICGGASNALIFNSTGNTNFFAVSCAALASTGITNANGSNVFTIYYRSEGGSVTGALPLVTGSNINQLLLTSATGTGPLYTVSVPGASATNGIDDSFASGVFKAPVQWGITAGGMRFAYLDTDLHPGCMVELIERGPAVDAFFSMVRRGAERWDGSRPLRLLT